MISWSSIRAWILLSRSSLLKTPSIERERDLACFGATGAAWTSTATGAWTSTGPGAG